MRGDRLLGPLALCLGLSPAALRARYRKPVAFMRLFHYPPNSNVAQNEFGAAEHKDYGFLTILAGYNYDASLMGVSAFWLILAVAFFFADGGFAIVGPYARLRPGTSLAEDVHVGNFVEVKNTRVEKGAKAKLLGATRDIHFYGVSTKKTYFTLIMVTPPGTSNGPPLLFDLFANTDNPAIPKRQG